MLITLAAHQADLAAEGSHCVTERYAAERGVEGCVKCVSSVLNVKNAAQRTTCRSTHCCRN